MKITTKISIVGKSTYVLVPYDYAKHIDLNNDDLVEVEITKI